MELLASRISKVQMHSPQQHHRGGGVGGVGGQHPGCPRGGIQCVANSAAWEVSQWYGASNTDGIDNQVAEMDHFISTIATTTCNIHASTTCSTSNVEAVLDAIQGKTKLYSTEDLMLGDSLASLVTRCEHADQTAQAADLVYIVRYVYWLFYSPINANLIYLYQYFLQDVHSQNNHHQEG